jgi:hypothetical protein
MSDKKAYKPYPDSGSLRATISKRTPMSPDYWGNIAINLNDMTNIKTEDGLTVIKLSGWKKVDASGKTYLSVSVDRFVPTNEAAPPPKAQPKPVANDMDDDIPF